MYQLDLCNVTPKEIFPLDDNYRDRSQAGKEIAFTNYYLTENGIPFFGVSGEFHFSRMSDTRWEDEIIKMKMNGINIMATYIFWNHHEEIENEFDFSGCRNLRKFIELCHKHGLYVIMRIGPFDHGEVRNGGIPDWIFGKPFEARQANEGFLSCVRKLYSQLGKQVQGLFFKDDGPIIGIQLDNEYMHSSACWNPTQSTSADWVFGGNEGDLYINKLKEIALECHLTPAFFTCTGWGGAIAPEGTLALWGGYAYRPWMKFDENGRHPCTDEYIYQDFHNDKVVCNYDFHPRYRPESKPYACCEMGGGMMCTYRFRFRYPFKSVDAMDNIKIASGCNFLGYYMFHGGSNPLGKHGYHMGFEGEWCVCYDYQAALGEYGQLRESYYRLKNIHYFTGKFGNILCPLKTVLPEGASYIDPNDMDTLRFAVRTDGERGFLFINNFQDHAAMPDRDSETVSLNLKNDKLMFTFSIAGDENAILPFHMDLNGIDLVQATAQPVTYLDEDTIRTYVFMIPRGMKADFTFEKNVFINGCCKNQYSCIQTEVELFTVRKEDKSVRILCVNRELADIMYQLRSDGTLIFTDAALLENEGRLSIETYHARNQVYTYPKGILDNYTNAALLSNHEFSSVLSCYSFAADEKIIHPTVEQTAETRYTISIPCDFMNGLKDVLLRIDYRGDVGRAFLNSQIINDNFYNGATWDIGLKDFAGDLSSQPIVLVISPLKENARVNVDSPMAAQWEEADRYISELNKAALQPVYEIVLTE